MCKRFDCIFQRTTLVILFDPLRGILYRRLFFDMKYGMDLLALNGQKIGKLTIAIDNKQVCNRNDCQKRITSLLSTSEIKIKRSEMLHMSRRKLSVMQSRTRQRRTPHLQQHLKVSK
jgi:hypothetical protein